MPFHSIAEFIPILETAIGPALLISGSGLLLLTMVNRLNHVVDRARALAGQIAEGGPDSHSHKTAQLDILWQRAGLIRRAIMCASTGALFAALLIVALFLSALFGIEDAWLLGGLFVAAMGGLILSLLFFLRDIDRSLVALKVELRGDQHPRPVESITAKKALSK